MKESSLPFHLLGGPTFLFFRHHDVGDDVVLLEAPSLPRFFRTLNIEAYRTPMPGYWAVWPIVTKSQLV